MLGRSDTPYGHLRTLPEQRNVTVFDGVFIPIPTNPTPPRQPVIFSRKRFMGMSKYPRYVSIVTIQDKPLELYNRGRIKTQRTGRDGGIITLTDNYK